MALIKRAMLTLILCCCVFPSSSANSQEEQQDTMRTQTFPDGSTYTGEWNKDIKEGQGIQTYADGSVYKGTFHDNTFNGHGTLTVPPVNDSTTSTIYVGEWKNSQMHGEGSITYVDGSKYSGEWENNKKNGQGIFTDTNGKKLNGTFKDGTFVDPAGSGIETIDYESGAQYIGQLKDKLYHGLGTYIFPDGKTMYTGQWKNDKKNGQGLHIFQDGSSYEGTWKNGMMDGKGIHTLVDGNSRSGNFKDNFFIEPVIVTGSIQTIDFKDGAKYVGQMNNDKMHGTGTLRTIDGTTYSGDWRENKHHGKGTITYSSGNKYSGKWKNNVFHGQGIFNYNDGSTYTGRFYNGKKHGQGEFVDSSSGSILSGIFKDGKFLAPNDEKQGNRLLNAAKNGDLTKVEEKLELYANIEHRSEKNAYTALIYAAAKGYVDIVNFLIEKGANVNVIDKHGTSALEFATKKGYKEITTLLIEAGAGAGVISKEERLMNFKGTEL